MRKLIPFLPVFLIACSMQTPEQNQQIAEDNASKWAVEVGISPSNIYCSGVTIKSNCSVHSNGRIIRLTCYPIKDGNTCTVEPDCLQNSLIE